MALSLANYPKHCKALHGVSNGESEHRVCEVCGARVHRVAVR